MVSPLRRPMPYIFTTPTTSEGPAGGGRLFIRFRLTRGITVMRVQGTWQEIRYPTEDQTGAADPGYVFKGGYKNYVTAQQRTELIAAGYANYLSTETTLTVQANSGSTVLTVADTSGMSIGNYASAAALAPVLITNIGTNTITIATPTPAQALFVGDVITVSK